MSKIIGYIIGLIISLVCVGVSFYYFFQGNDLLFWVFIIVGIVSFIYIWRKLRADLRKKDKKKNKKDKKKKK